KKSEFDFDDLPADGYYNHTAPYFYWDTVTSNTGSIAGYYVYFGNDPAGDPSADESNLQTDTNYTVTDELESGTDYYLRIMTKDGSGLTASSVYEAFTYRYDSTAPAAPTPISGWNDSSKGTSISDGGWGGINNPYFSWDNPTDNAGIAGYYVYFGDQSNADPETHFDASYRDNYNYGPYFYGNVALTGQPYYLIVKTKDNADNVSATSTTFTYKWDNSPPDSESIVITEAFSNSDSATLTLSATDDQSGIANMKLSENSDFSGADWVGYSTSVNFTLSDGDGEKTIHAKFENNAGQESMSASDTIIKDTALPTGSLSIDAGSNQSDDAEGGAGAWTMTGNWGTTTSEFHGGSTSFADSPGGNYNDNDDFSMTLANPLDFSNVSSAELTFWHRYDTEYDTDYGHVEISTNNG
ncbi:MAG: fibronectin type III domain-containing protein, partial [Proteobacteria bacterium]|nr:fibronectin type III domain-containing protein [Pseudomonadota bacterium]